MDERQREPPASAQDRPIERLVMLTDGVFAIAMTLLAIELRLLEEAAHRSHGALLRAILATWPQVLAFAQSFGVLALYWSAHHRLFRYLVRVNGRLVWLTLAFLLTICFLPFPTAVLGAHLGDPAAGLLYGSSLFATNAVFWATWRYVAAARHRLAPELNLRLVRRIELSFGGSALIFLGLILLAVWDLLSPRGHAPFLAAVVLAALLALVILVFAIRDFGEPE